MTPPILASPAAPCQALLPPASHHAGSQVRTALNDKGSSGEVLSTDPQAKIEQPALGLKRMNTAHKLTWTIQIPPNEKQLVTYIHRLCLRR